MVEVLVVAFAAVLLVRVSLAVCDLAPCPVVRKRLAKTSTATNTIADKKAR
jgi:hypothetical protein